MKHISTHTSFDLPRIQFHSAVPPAGPVPSSGARIVRSARAFFALASFAVLSVKLFAADPAPLGNSELASTNNPGSSAESNETIFGPVFSRFRLTLDPGERTEIAGPLFSLEQSDTRRTWGLHPLFSYGTDPETDLSELDLLYPIFTYRRFGNERRYQLIQLLSISGGETMRGTTTRRVTLFPFYFQQRSPDPALNYTAFMPFYGHLKNRLFRDEINFVMLPFYLETRKKDVVTDNYVFPFFHLRHGEGLRGWQFWPVAGVEHKEITTRTNAWGDIETIPGHDKRFILWPFFFHNHLGIGSENPQRQLVLVPFYSKERSPQRDVTTYFWPFGYMTIVDREKKYREWAFPWPLIDFARGEGKTANRVWPFFGRAKNATLESDFYLWPVYKYNRAHADPLDRERTRILFFLYSDLMERNTATGTALHRTDFWPLFTARRDHNGNEQLQVLSIVEPFLPNNKSIERNYSPLWAIWRSQRNVKSGQTSQALLWNLYRRETGPNRKKVSLLFGLFHYQSEPEGKRWRIFYIPFGYEKRTTIPSAK